LPVRYRSSKGAANTIGMNKGGTVDAGGLKATMTHAIHSSSIQDDGKSIYGGEAAGFVFHFAEGRRAYFAGDTGVMPDMKLIADLYAPELAFLPIGGHYTMGPREAAMACRMIRPKKVIPMHYGTFPPLTGRPAHLAALIEDLPGTEVWSLEPGKTVTW
jgi:L-ascorbate metabolism protein UlaG (beta-lactamase superfamily)